MNAKNEKRWSSTIPVYVSAMRGTIENERCRWKVSDDAVNIEKCTEKSKATPGEPNSGRCPIPLNDKAAAAPGSRRFVSHRRSGSLRFAKSVRAHSDIKRLSRLVVVCMRTRNGPDDFNSCPAPHDLMDARFVERCSVHEALVFLPRSRSVRGSVRMCSSFVHSSILFSPAAFLDFSSFSGTTGGVIQERRAQ